MAVLFGPQNIERAFGERTLARIPMAGGARRDLTTGVVDADWIPGTDTLALIRDPGGGRPWTVEFPAGTTVHEAPAAWSLRVSPDGNRVAFFEGPMLFGSRATGLITVVERSGAQVECRAWLGRVWIGLDAVGTGDLVHGHAARAGRAACACRLALGRRADGASRARLARAARHLRRRPGAAVSQHDSHRSCLPAAGRRPERDLTWQFASSANGTLAGWRDADLRRRTGRRAVWRTRRSFDEVLDGSPAVPIGEGAGGALSPDGKWVLRVVRGQLVLWPTGRRCDGHPAEGRPR